MMEEPDLLESSQSEIISETKVCLSGLESLKEEHHSLLGGLREEANNRVNSDRKNSDDLINERIKAVTASLSKLDVGVEEGGVILPLAKHFNRLEAEKTLTQMEMERIKVTLRYTLTMDEALQKCLLNCV